MDRPAACAAQATGLDRVTWPPWRGATQPVRPRVGHPAQRESFCRHGV